MAWTRFHTLIGNNDRRMKWVAEDLAKEWTGSEPTDEMRIRRWALQFQGLLNNLHGNAYAVGVMESGKNPKDFPIGDVSLAVRDSESYYLGGFRNDLLAGDKRYFDADGKPNAKAIHDRMRMYLGRARGVTTGGWVDASHENTFFAWILGTVEAHCPDCIIFSERGPYTKAQLPAVPGDNSTPCLYNCDCRLQKVSDGSYSPLIPELPPYDNLAAEEPPSAPPPAEDESPVLVTPHGGQPEFMFPANAVESDDEFAGPAALDAGSMDPQSAELYSGDIYTAWEKSDPGKVKKIQNAIHHVFGYDVEPKGIARIAGVPAGSNVTIGEENGAVVVEAYQKALGFSMLRRYARQDGQIVAHHDFIEVLNGPRLTGARIFAREVVMYLAAGVAWVYAHAVGAPGRKMSGYKVWPRLGFNASFDADMQDWLLGAGYPAKDMNELYVLYGMRGREFWEKNGDTVDVEFDLREGSESYRRFLEYIENEGIDV